jgi:hypothetical protein
MKTLASGFAFVLAGLAVGAVSYRALQPAPAAARTAGASKIERVEVSEPTLHPSNDTLETLKDPALPDRAARLALWLPHASLEDVVKFWEHLNSNKPVPEPLLSLVLARWVVLDPQGAVAADGKMDSGFSVWEAWAAWDPRAAETAARTGGEPMALMRVLQAIAGRDPDYVAKQLEEGFRSSQQIVPKLIDGFIAQNRFDKAMDAALRFGRTFQHRETVLKEWSKRAPGEVLHWGTENPHLFGSDQNDGVIMRIVQQSEDKVPDILAKMPSSDIKTRVERAYAFKLAERDPSKAIGFAETMGSPLARDSLLGELGRKFSASKPAAAAEILGKLLDHEAKLGEYPVAVFFLEGERNGWHSTDSPLAGFAEDLVVRIPELAMDAVMASGKPAYQDAARQLASDWMERDRWDFGTWLARQPVDTMRDDLVQTFSRRLAGGSEPAFPEAVTWATSVGDATRRDQLVDDLLENWKAEDPDALHSYLAASNTPESVRSRAKKLAE